MVGRYMNPDTSEEVSVDSTIGTEYVSKIFNRDGKLFDIHLWDTAGQEKHRY
jgi:GTPase SAR1 family protein